MCFSRIKQRTRCIVAEGPTFAEEQQTPTPRPHYVLPLQECQRSGSRSHVLAEAADAADTAVAMVAMAVASTTSSPQPTSSRRLRAGADQQQLALRVSARA